MRSSIQNTEPQTMGGLENDLSNNWNCEICLGSVGFHKVSTYLLLVKTIYWRRKPSLFHGLVVEMPMIQESKLGAKNFTQRMRKNESTKLDPVKPPLDLCERQRCASPFPRPPWHRCERRASLSLACRCLALWNTIRGAPGRRFGMMVKPMNSGS